MRGEAKFRRHPRLGGYELLTSLADDHLALGYSVIEDEHMTPEIGAGINSCELHKSDLLLVSTDPAARRSPVHHALLPPK
jgi:hypothetical protein